MTVILEIQVHKEKLEHKVLRAPREQREMTVILEILVHREKQVCKVARVLKVLQGLGLKE